jgi:hypothetical protein
MLCLKKLRCDITLSDAILLDKTTDIARKSQLSTMVRYVTNNRTAEGQFLGFNNVCGDRSAKAIAEQVFKCLDEYGIGKKQTSVSNIQTGRSYGGRIERFAILCREKIFRYPLCSLLRTKTVLFFLRPFVIQRNVKYFLRH